MRSAVKDMLATVSCLPGRSEYWVTYYDPDNKRGGSWDCASERDALQLAREAAFDAGPHGFAVAWHGESVIARFVGANEVAS